MAQNRLLRKRILLVEDERIVRDAIGLLLSLDEHTVVGVSNGGEALAAFAKDQFDLVMTDFEMPSMKGNELASRIKKVAPRQPVLMMTAYEKALDSWNQVDAVLCKPFSLDQLREVMAQLIPATGERLAA